MFYKILVANRGEIALRVIRACREMGIRSVAVYSTADANSLHVRAADESICIGPPAPRDSYLYVPSLISAAEVTNSEAIHPGYGFLSENYNFAEVCENCGIKFIGPPSKLLSLMGNKVNAKVKVEKMGVPVLPGANKELRDEEEALRTARETGFPVILKASLGGGGRGMKIVNTAANLGSDECVRGAIHLHREIFREGAAHRIPGDGGWARKRGAPWREGLLDPEETPEGH
jgi:acetyl-CoA carboxylase biotin carboxylase subunit